MSFAVKVLSCSSIAKAIGSFKCIKVVAITKCKGHKKMSMKLKISKWTKLGRHCTAVRIASAGGSLHAFLVKK